MPRSTLISWNDGDALGGADKNAELNHLLGYLKEDKDSTIGDNAEGTGVVPHDHEGVYGKVLGTDALEDSAVKTAKIEDGAITDSKLATDAVKTSKVENLAITAAKLAVDAVETAKVKNENITFWKLDTEIKSVLYSNRLIHLELVFETSDYVTVSFPWRDPGWGTWSNVTGIDVSKNVTASGNVKDGVTANEASKWYYLYISNSFTVTQPTKSQFLFTQSAAGESGYTLIGAIYNNSSQQIEPFDQYGRVVMWRNPINVLVAGTSSSYADIDCSAMVPANSYVIKLAGTVEGTADSNAGSSISCCIVKNGITPVYNEAQILAANASYVLNAGTISISGNRDIHTDTVQIIEYKVANNNVSNVSVNIYVTGYHVR